MSVFEALYIVERYLKHDEVTLLKAIHTIGDDAFSDPHTQSVRERCREALLVIKWDYRYIVGRPHDRHNPGVVADAVLYEWAIARRNALAVIPHTSTFGVVDTVTRRVSHA